MCNRARRSRGRNRLYVAYDFRVLRGICTSRVIYSDSDYYCVILSKYVFFSHYSSVIVIVLFYALHARMSYAGLVSMVFIRTILYYDISHPTHLPSWSRVGLYTSRIIIHLHRNTYVCVSARVYKGTPCVQVYVCVCLCSYGFYRMMANGSPTATYRAKQQVHTLCAVVYVCILMGTCTSVYIHTYIIRVCVCVCYTCTWPTYESFFLKRRFA